MRQKVTVPQLQKKLCGQVREFVVGDQVLVKNFSSKPKWIPGVVVQKLGSTNYEVQLVHGSLVHRHINQMVKKRYGMDQEEVDDVTAVQSRSEESQSETQREPTSYESKQNEDPSQAEQDVLTPHTEVAEATSMDETSPNQPNQEPQMDTPRRSTRVRKPPSRFQEYL